MKSDKNKLVSQNNGFSPKENTQEFNRIFRFLNGAYKNGYIEVGFGNEKGEIVDENFTRMLCILSKLKSENRILLSNVEEIIFPEITKRTIIRYYIASCNGETLWVRPFSDKEICSLTTIKYEKNNFCIDFDADFYSIENYKIKKESWLQKLFSYPITA
jgi:hypothetical protein